MLNASLFKIFIHPLLYAWFANRIPCMSIFQEVQRICLSSLLFLDNLSKWAPSLSPFTPCACKVDLLYRMDTVVYSTTHHHRTTIVEASCTKHVLIYEFPGTLLIKFA